MIARYSFFIFSWKNIDKNKSKHVHIPLNIPIICREWAETAAAQTIDVGVIMDQQLLLGEVSNCTMTMAMEDFYHGPDGPGFKIELDWS